MNTIKVKISVGQLLDKIYILEENHTNLRREDQIIFSYLKFE